jgi:ribosomal-protein-alanine N-acetyltransferase
VSGRVEELRGARVLLRPLALEEERAVWELRALAGFTGPESPGALERFRRRVERSGELADGKLWLAVEHEGQLVGDVEARQPIDALPPGVFELGIALFPEHQGRGLGADAVATLTTHLFEAEAAERVQAGTATWNEPMQKVLDRLGFRAEGVMRAFMPASGGRDDYVLYAVTRDEWESRRS